MSFLPSFNNICLLIFYFYDRYSGNAGEILKNQALKNHKFPLLFYPFCRLLQRPSRNKKRSKKGSKGKHCKQINKEKVGLRLPRPSSPIWGKLVSSSHFHALFHNLLKVGYNSFKLLELRFSLRLDSLFLIISSCIK